jgi:hypothetical protein
MQQLSSVMSTAFATAFTVFSASVPSPPVPLIPTPPTPLSPSSAPVSSPPVPPSRLYDTSTPSFRRRSGISILRPPRASLTPITPSPSVSRISRATSAWRTSPVVSPPSEAGEDHDEYDEFEDTNTSREDPPWDTHDRSGFDYPKSRTFIKTNRGPLPPVRGTHWYQFLTNPLEDTAVDPARGTIAPWLAYRPDYDEVVNHPIELSLVQMDKELFLGAFHKAYQPKNLRDFTSGFPTYEGSSDLRYLLTFYSNVVNHCATFGIYVPPLHTLRPGLCYGIWFDDLFPETQSDAATTFPLILRNALLSKYTGLKGHEKFGSSLMHETDGYKIMFRLAVLGQHPMLVDYPALP